MSEFLAAAAQAMGVPETLVQRSADARAKASGQDADAIIQAWAGGEAVATAPAAPDPEPTATPEQAPEPAASQTAREPETPSQPAPVAAATAVAVAEPPTPEVEPIVAAPVSERIGVAARIGAVAGVVLATVGWVFAAQFMIPNADMIGADESVRAAFGVETGRLILISLVVSVSIGMMVAGLTRMIPSWTSPGRRLVGSPIPSVAVGALVGGLAGALLAALMLGLGEPPELPDDPTVVPAMASIIWALVFWAGAGWLIGALVQTLGVPDGVESIDLDEVRTVKARLVSAFGLPLLALLTIAVLVLSFAYVFLSFPSWSPLTGTVIAGSILGFAALSASKPNMKVGLQELIVAAAGIGVVVVLIFAALQTTGAGHHEEEGEESGHTEESETGDTTETTAAGEASIAISF